MCSVAYVNAVIVDLTGVDMLQVGGGHTALITEHGCVYTFGAGVEGQVCIVLRNDREGEKERE